MLLIWELQFWFFYKLIRYDCLKQSEANICEFVKKYYSDKIRKSNVEFLDIFSEGKKYQYKDFFTRPKKSKVKLSNCVW